MTQETSTIEIPTLNSPLSEIELLSIKLTEEITHLEKWMASQRKSNRKSSDAIINTIQELIQTRKKLLATLQTPPSIEEPAPTAARRAAPASTEEISA